MSGPDVGHTIHASAIVLDGKGLLILGPSGSGKSSLALEMMARGATLVADDRCFIQVQDDKLFVSPPATIAGQIEARGIGILNADFAPFASIDVIVDLGRTSPKRLPEQLTMTLAGVTLPLVYKVDNPSFPALLLQVLRGGRRD